MDLATLNAGFANPATFLPELLKLSRSRYEWDAYRQFEPEFHKISSKPDRLVSDTTQDCVTDADGNKSYPKRVQAVSKVALALQKIIVTRAAAFATAGDMTITADTPTEQYEELLKDLKKVYKRNKVEHHNTELFEAVISQLEAAEIWYTETIKNEEGVAVDGKIKGRFYYPAEGWELLPVYDNRKDLIAFALKYKDAETKLICMDVYTTDFLRKYVQDGPQGWREREPAVPLRYGKIPVIYHEVPKSAWADVQNMIEILEHILSVYGDAIDYNAWPILLLAGEVQSLPNPGQAGSAIQMENGATAAYLNYSSEPQAVTAYVDILMRNIYSLTQTPDLNFEAMKGLGDISGVAFKRMLIDAHLKAMRAQRGWYGIGQQRRANLVVAMLKTIEATKYGNVDIDIDIKYNLASIDDVRDQIDNMLAANGGKPLIDHKASVAAVGLTADPKATYQAIEADATAAFEQQQALATQNNNQGQQ